jgi:1,4-dihydroxy-6-naphthoate synthase
MKLSLGFSPCPNDTFIFDSLVNNKMDTQGLELEVVLEDVQTLNEWARQGKLDITKISYGVLPLVSKEYIVLGSGGALGKGVGPLLIANNNISPDKIHDCIIGIPGENTTANLLFSLAFPNAENKSFMPFYSIEDFVLQGKGGSSSPHAGVIIHENRFTYQQKGLTKLMDLGEYWEEKTGLPIPLGGIVARRNLGPELHKKINELIRKSVEISFSQYPSISEYIKQHSQEMSEDVMRQHIDLYVNDYSLDLGEDGKKAVLHFLEIFNLNSSTPVNTNDLFI